jgi:type II secretory pathway pseudopilin PulG
LSRVHESNGPDVKIRGPAAHVAEKYLQLARDAQSSGDPVAAENYFQHAEHYFRLIAAAQEQFRQNQPYYQQQPGGGDQRVNGSDDGYDDGDNDQGPGEGEPFAPRDMQQPFYPREQHGQPQQSQPRPQFQSGNNSANNEADVDRLPSFITGGGQPQGAPTQQGNGSNNPNGQNGYDGSPDRFPLHRRRRRHRSGGPRDHSMGGEGGDTPGSRQNDD